MSLHFSRLSFGDGKSNRLFDPGFPVETKSGYFVTESLAYDKQNLHKRFRDMSQKIIAFDDRSILGVSFDGGKNIITDRSPQGNDYLILWRLQQAITDHKNSAC